MSSSSLTFPASKADGVPFARGARTWPEFLDPSCRACRDAGVPPEGGESPQVFVVGEAPGPDEDRLRRPFVGRSGRLLRECLTEAGFSGDKVWITNVVKRFPFEERDGRRAIRRPSPLEVESCLPHLAREIRELRPRLLVALGRTAAEGLLGTRLGPLGPLRRGVFSSRADLRGAPVFVTHHPSALFYGALRGQRRGFVDDLRAAQRFIVDKLASAG